MKLWTVLLFFLCTTALCTTPLISADQVPERESDTATTLRSLELLKFDAQLHKNTSALDAMFDDGLMWMDDGGALFTKASYLENLRNSHPTQLRIEAMKINVFDRMAIVSEIYEERGFKTGQPYHRHCRFIDTWSLKNGKWVLIAATATSTIA